jgi:hypothetical protein
MIEKTLITTQGKLRGKDPLAAKRSYAGANDAATGCARPGRPGCHQHPIGRTRSRAAIGKRDAGDFMQFADAVLILIAPDKIPV